jgi:hypothetical protein
MAAGLGFKTFAVGEVLSAANVNGYLMQGVLVFANATARDAAITSPQEGQFAFTKDNDSLWYYSGSAWVSSGATGDIEGVTAGVGISGGGTSGTVTVTNSMATAIDAKGDLIAGTGADTFARLAVGTNGHTLVANSATATGLEWQAPAGGGTLPTFSAYGTSTQTLSQNTATKITFDTESWDSDSKFTDSRFTPTVAGYYDVTGSLLVEPNGSATLQVYLYKNGSSWQYLNYRVSVTGQNMQQGSVQVYLDTDDYIEVYAEASVSSTTIYKSSTYGFFSAIGVRS